jgi:hypothetical protein
VATRRGRQLQQLVGRRPFVSLAIRINGQAGELNQEVVVNLPG